MNPYISAPKNLLYFSLLPSFQNQYYILSFIIAKDAVKINEGFYSVSLICSACYCSDHCKN